MTSREIVCRAIAFEQPPRLPFWQHEVEFAPDDVCDIWEMDRARAGWFFGVSAYDDWGCRWYRTEVKNMGSVVEHPLGDWSRWKDYRPPDPRDPFYFERIEPLLDQAGDRYVVITCHFNLIERAWMLRGMPALLEDLYEAPERVKAIVEMVLEFKLGQLEELYRRFGNRIDGIFLTDDWGTQRGPLIRPVMFDEYFAPCYRQLFGAIHGYGWHVILHSCGKINLLVPRLIELGVDVLNMQQPRAYGLVEFGQQFRGKVCFLTTVDIQATLPRNDPEAICEEARLLVENWGTPDGGFIVFNYGDAEALGAQPEMTRVMFQAFVKLQHFWQQSASSSAG